MSSARLVTLSACETGITDIMKGSADEFVGLPAGFMLAGCSLRGQQSLVGSRYLHSLTYGPILFQSY
jgi:CHAT domain